MEDRGGRFLILYLPSSFLHLLFDLPAQTKRLYRPRQLHGPSKPVSQQVPVPGLNDFARVRVTDRAILEPVW